MDYRISATMITLGLSFVFCGFFIGAVQSQTTGVDAQGAVYVLHFLNISTDRVSEVYQEVYLSSGEEVLARLTVPNAAIHNNILLDATSNPPYTHQLTIRQDLGVPSGDNVEKNAALLVSRDAKPIWATVNKMEAGTTAAYLALPITQNANEFFIPSYTAGTARHTGYAVASLYDGTCMEVYYVKGNDYSRQGLHHLDRLEVFTALDDTVGADYTGIFINSTKPMAVFGGHECAQIPNGKQFCDAIVEQVPPVIEWGTEHIVAPISGRNIPNVGYTVRVIAGDSDTEVTWDPSDQRETVAPSLLRGDFYENKTANSGSSTVLVKCSKPCLVVQYNHGQLDDANEGLLTDPFMMIVPPIDRYVDQMRFSTAQHYSRDLFLNNLDPRLNCIDYITIVTKSAMNSSVRLDGGRLTGGSWVPIPQKPAYSYYMTRLVPGFHAVTGVDEMMAWVYGHGTADKTGYGFMAGYKMNDPPIADSSLFDFAEPTTASPGGGGGGTGGGGGGGGVLPPWLQGNWTDDFTAAELPTFGLRFKGMFFVKTREAKIIEEVCSHGYFEMYKKHRVAVLERHLNDDIGALCPGMDGSVIALSAPLFYTEYTRGRLDLILTITGSGSHTFRNITDCALILKDYVLDVRNWPAVVVDEPIGGGATRQKDLGPTDMDNFLERDGPLMNPDCADVEMRLVSDVYVPFEDIGQDWICSGEEASDVLGKETSGAARVVPAASLVFVLVTAILSALVTARG